jgi:DNA-binding response OmpR family regulator
MASPQSHILYIEDHEDTRELITLVLGRCNHRVTTASRIDDALKLAREQRFDLYILDSWLPDGTGIELCKRLREFDDRTPIMFLSGLAYEADKQAAMDHGAQQYLVKPADMRVLSKEVNVLLGITSKHERAEVFTKSHFPLPGDTDGPMMFGGLTHEIVAL